MRKRIVLNKKKLYFGPIQFKFNFFVNKLPWAWISIVKIQLIDDQYDGSRHRLLLRAVARAWARLAGCRATRSRRTSLICCSITFSRLELNFSFPPSSLQQQNFVAEPPLLLSNLCASRPPYHFISDYSTSFLPTTFYTCQLLLWNQLSRKSTHSVGSSVSFPLLLFQLSFCEN